MAYAEKRAGVLTGQWFGRVRLKTGEFKRAFDSKKEADAYEAYVRVYAHEPPMMREDGTPLPAQGRSFREIAERCKAAGGPRGVWGARKDASLMQRLDYAVARLGDYSIDDITRGLVREKVIEPLRRTPRAAGSKYRPKGPQTLKQGTINRYVSAVSAVLTWAQREDLLRARPELEFRAERDREERVVISFALEDAIVAQLQADGYGAHAVCVRFLAESGMRAGELFGLTPDQIKNDHVVLRKEQTKTHRTRTVYVRADLCREVRVLVASRALPDPTHLLKVFQAAAKSVGSERRVVIHGLRHTRATRLMEARVPREIRMYILGHRRGDVHDDYVHVSLDEQRRAAEAVDQIRGHGRAEVVVLAKHTVA